MANREPKRAVPHAIDTAEKGLIGAALYNFQAAEHFVHTVDPGDFYHPFHQAVASAIRALVIQGVPPRVPALADEMTAQGFDFTQVDGGMVALMGFEYSGYESLSAKYAETILEMAARRQFLSQTYEAMDWAYDPAVPMDQIEDKAKEAVSSLIVPMTGRAPAPTVTEFLANRKEQTWLVPGLIEKQERVVITAPEGYGKSTLGRQIAVQLASRCHPFTHRWLDQHVACLIIDAENSDDQIGRSLDRLVKATKANGYELVPEFLRVQTRMDGLDLTTTGDVRWLMERVASARPDVLFIGPLYKLHNEDPKEERPAKKVASVIDRIRALFGCAVFMETHQPYGNSDRPADQRPCRPMGASLWSRWPEVGIGLVPVTKEPMYAHVKHWRGSREQRDWPRGLQKGGSWMWTPWNPNAHQPAGRVPDRVPDDF